jgi:hypothetical protein
MHTRRCPLLLVSVSLLCAACGSWQKGDALRHVQAGKWPTEEVAAQARALAIECDDDSGGRTVHQRAEACWRVGSLFERWSGIREMVELFQDRACAVDARECR